MLFKLAYDQMYNKVPGITTPKSFNVVTMLGISGAGKTSVTGQYILKFLLKDEPKQNITISGPNEDRTIALNKAITETLKEEEEKK